MASPTLKPREAAPGLPLGRLWNQFSHDIVCREGHFQAWGITDGDPTGQLLSTKRNKGGGLPGLHLCLQKLRGGGRKLCSSDTVSVGREKTAAQQEDAPELQGCPHYSGVGRGPGTWAAPHSLQGQGPGLG